MSWIDQDGADQLRDELSLLADEMSSIVDSLAEQFGGNETSGVIALVAALTATATEMHEVLGVLHLGTLPTIDIANEVDLSRRWTEGATTDGRERDEWGDRERDIRVAFQAVVIGAKRAAGPLWVGLARVDAEFNASGCPSSNALAELSAATATLVEWSHIYIETADGYNRVLGHLPDTLFGGGPLAEMRDWERAEAPRASCR